ncbi:hypothetical protein BZA77DRAFT_352866 [Pyronema omphalodes]|nr:hypothetical protein BZA77DRAFT_352866 [Pyronema omphalodes]
MTTSLLSLPEAQELINLAFSTKSQSTIPTVLSIDALPDIHFSSIFILTLSSPDPTIPPKVILKVSPPPTIRLLYNDLQRTVTEASVLELLSHFIWNPATGIFTHNHSTPKPAQPKTNASLSAILNHPIAVPETKSIVFPRLIYHSIDKTSFLTSPWILETFLPFENFMDVGKNTPRTQLDVVRRLATIVNPAGTFGAVTSFSIPSKSPGISRPSPPPPNSPDATETPSPLPTPTTTRRLSNTHNTWSSSFTSLLEATLRDGEAAQVMIDYATIRGQLARFRGYLEDVKEARLVLFGVRVMGDGEGVVGLDQAIWGDGDLAVVWGEDHEDHEDEGDYGVKVRCALYRVFKAVTRIVGCYYYEQDTEVEMKERRRLVEVLRGLEKMGKE